MKLKTILIAALAASSTTQVSAIGIGSLTTEMQESEFYVVKQIKNDDSVAKFVSFQIKQVNNPRQLKILSVQKNDVLVSPATVFLPPKRSADVKIYYQGLRDNNERYYQLSFIEQSVSSQSNISDGVSLSARQRLRLSSVLVVRPRLIRFKYEQDDHGRVRNVGNTFVQVTATGSCKEKQSSEPHPCSRSIFLLPGESSDLRKEKDIVSIQGVGVWKGTDYNYFPINSSRPKVAAQ
ncbi:hypothetical protein [Burkholderia territorii]|uniref:EcpB family pilus assembly chaperone n=1 Tax=Burkholderia territorii TaxID=1503055 RepID=UPI000AE2F9C1|nr:hypothetical protein [Burkholderia territorii]